MPFGKYKNLKECVAQNSDKGDPAAYCATIMRKVEGKDNEWIQYTSVGIHRDFSATASEAITLNNVLKIPVVLAAEMVQKYHRSELPLFIQGQLPNNVRFVKVFKDYNELKKAAEVANEIPFVIPHSNGTFLKCNKNLPDGYRKRIEASTGYISDEEVFGMVKEIRADDLTRTIKGMLYLRISKNDPVFVDRLKSGEIIDVSIGFASIFDRGGFYKKTNEEYLLTQRNMIFGHLAGLPDDQGKCPKTICGTNRDESTMDGSVSGGIDIPQIDGSDILRNICFVDVMLQPVFDISVEPQAVDITAQRGGIIYDDQYNSLNSLKIVKKETFGDNTTMAKTDLELLQDRFGKLEIENQSLKKELGGFTDKAIEGLRTELTDSKKKNGLLTDLCDSLKAKVIEKDAEIEIKDAKILKFEKDEAESEDKNKKALIEKLVPLNLKRFPREKLEGMDMDSVQTVFDALSDAADSDLKKHGMQKPAPSNDKTYPFEAMPSTVSGTEKKEEDK